jgi:hypothetical protein
MLRATQTVHMISHLSGLLREVYRAAGKNFTGVGVLISDEPDVLPILPLRSATVLFNEQDLVETLAAISVPSSEYQDGFHIVSSDWRLTLMSQYFSPPIVQGAMIDRTKLFGGRYIAALFGSALPSVQLSGIASRGFGIAVFASGKEHVFEAMP